MSRARFAVPTIAFMVAAIPAYAQETTCALSGTVVARSIETGAFVEGAEVSIPRLSKSTVSDATGSFRLGGITCGKQEVQVRKIGFTVWRDTVDLVAGQEAKRTYTLISVAQLDTVRTTSDEIAYQTPRLQDFEARRKRNVGGYFIGESDLRKQEHVSVPSILRSRIPGLQFVSYRNITVAKGRAGSMSSESILNPDDVRSPKGCWAIVYLDGLLIFDGIPRKGVLPPDIGQFFALNLSGAEYYSNAGSMPLQFKITQNNCGTLLLWTRGR